MSELNLPWTKTGDDSEWQTPSCDAEVCGSAAIYDAIGNLVGYAVNVGWNDKDAERREAIIRAVNCHDDLLDALKLVREMGWPETRKPGVPDRLLDAVDAAIRKAEGNE